MIAYQAMVFLLCIFIGVRVIRSFAVTTKAGRVLLTAASHYRGFILVACTTFIMPYIYLGDWAGRYVIVLLVILADSYLKRAYLGEYGVKVHDQFIPRDRIIGYQFVNEQVEMIDLIVAGHQTPIRLKINKKKVPDDLVQVLDAYILSTN